MAAWRKSSYSAEGQSCVEVATGIGIRDTKSPSSHIAVASRSWSAFLLSVKAAKFAPSGQTNWSAERHPDRFPTMRT